MLEDLQIRNYAPTTVAAYIRSVAEFANTSANRRTCSARSRSGKYQLYLIKEKGVSLSSYIQAVCAPRFLYSNTLHHDAKPLPRRKPTGNATSSALCEATRATKTISLQGASGREGQSETAHTGRDGGMRMKASDLSYIPLRADCHGLRRDSYHRIDASAALNRGTA
jgi:hypothetical protein